MKWRNYKAVEAAAKQRRKVSQLIILLLVISFVCAFIVELRTTAIIRATSYALSMTVSTGLPSIITSLASLYYITLFLYWGMMPPKKGVYLSAGSLALLEFVILISGERGEPISLMLTVLFYILLRNRREIHDIVISKKFVVIILIIIPFFLSALQALSFTRVKKEYTTDSVLSSVEDFFETQGGSVKIVANGYDLKNQITSMGGNTFVIGTIRNYVKSNIFTRMIFGKEKTTRTISDAFSGDSYLASYGYAYSPVTYQKNVGSGSTYVAEVYHDGGYLLLLIANILIALLSYHIDTFQQGSIIRTSIVMNIFRYIVLLPRGIVLQWLVNTFAFQNIILFLVLYMLLNRKTQEESSIALMHQKGRSESSHTER